MTKPKIILIAGSIAFVAMSLYLVYNQGRLDERALILNQSGDSTVTSNPNTVTMDDFSVPKYVRKSTIPFEDPPHAKLVNGKLIPYRVRSEGGKAVAYREPDLTPKKRVNDAGDNTEKPSDLTVPDTIWTPDTTHAVIGSDSLNVTVGIVDLGNRYLFSKPTFKYPSRTITVTKYVAEPPPFFTGIHYGFDISSEFKRPLFEFAPFLGLGFDVERTRILPYIGARFGEIEPQYRYGINVEFK